MHLRAVFVSIAVFATGLFVCGARASVQTAKMSGVYLTASDYEAGKLALDGDCWSKARKLEIHDISNKPYIDVTHDSEKHRYSKSELYGYRACDGRDYRFASKLEYQILEAKELYVYVRDVSVSQGRTYRTAHEYYFTVGANGPIEALTMENLKQAFPDNHRFHDWLDATFGGGQSLAEYEFHKMFKVNRLLIASREP